MATYISARSLVANESDGFVDIILTLSAATPGGVTVTYAASYVTADFNDYTDVGGTLTFGAAETSKTLRVNLTNDVTTEGHESIYFLIYNGVNAVVANSNFIVTIAANDQSPGVPNASVRGTAVDEKAGTALFTVFLDRPSDSTVSLNWNVAGLTAIAGSDFGNVNGTLTFTPGQTAKSFEVPITDDATAEGDELFQVNITSPTAGIVVAQGTAIGRIGANDAANVSSPVIWMENAVGGEADGWLDFIVRLSAPSAQEVRITYSSGHTNTENDDANTAIDGMLVFAPGETMKVLRVDISDDSAFEQTESFYLFWTTPVGAVLGQNYTFGTIIDNDSTAGTPLISIRDVRVDEKTGTARFLVWLDKPSNQVVRVSWSTVDGTAAAGSDFDGALGTLSFLPGETAKMIDVAILDDATAEGAERFAVQLGDPVGATIGQSRGWGFIAPSDNTPTSSPTITIESTVVDEAAGIVDVTVRLSAPSSQQVGVTLRDDYYGNLYQEYAYNGYDHGLTFAPGEVEKVIRYVIFDDSEFEPNHFFRVYLQTPVNAVLGNTYAVVTIAANDGAPGTPIASVGDGIVDEKGQQVAIVISLDRPSTEPASVSWAATQGTGNAVADADFRASSGSVTFAPGETSKTVWVPILDDADNEGFEIFNVTLSSPAGATLGRTLGTVLIGPSDAPNVSSPVARVHSTMFNESDGWVDVMVVLSAPSAQQVTVLTRDYYNNASADSEDFSYNTNQTFTFAPGETTKLIRYAIRPDTAAEGPETWHVNPYTPTNAVIGNPYAAVTIARNNDAEGTPVLSVHDLTVDEKTGIAQFHVVLDRPSTSLVVFNFAAANLSAGDGDFVPISGEMRLIPGQTSASIFVPLFDDATAENDELFTFSLSNLVNATAGQTVATGRIVANDAAAVATPVVSIEHSLADEFRGYVDIVFRLSAPSGNQVSVTWNDDYIGETWRDYSYGYDGVLIFAPGETVKTVRMSLHDDTASEPAESFYAQITAVSNAVVGNSRALITLVSSEGPSGTPVVLINDVAVDEKAGAATFFFALDRPSTETTSFGYDTQHISTALGDFGLRQGRIVFQPGQMLATLVVSISDDATAEGDEFFNVVLSDPQGLQLSQNNVLARIGGSDTTAVATPVISIESTVVNEAAGYAEVVVRLSAPSGQQVTVSYDDAYISDTWRDYSYGNSGTLVFAPGETLKTIRYAIHGETDAEPAESFYVRIHTPTNAVIGNPYATVTIAPSDGTGTTPYLRVDDVTVDEKRGSVVFVISLSQPAADIVSVGYASANGSAVASVEGVPGDYVGVSGRLSFAPGETTRRVTIPLNDDGDAEGEELFFLDLANAVGATIAQARGTARIGLSDGTLAATPTIMVESVVVNEATGFAEAVVKLNRPSAQQVSVAYANSVENTSQNGDYGGSNAGTLVFAPGETIKTVRWAIADDVTDEGHESFSIRLTNPVNGTLGPVNSSGWGFATIAPSDGGGAGLPSASIRDVVVDEKDGTARFVVTLDRPSTDLLSFDWNTLSPGGAGSATADVDFGARSGTISFWPGETTRTITVTIADDASNEVDESFNIILSAPVGGGIAQGLATARIVANDQNAVATPQIFIESTTVYEHQGYADVVVRLSAPSNNLVTVNYADSYPTGVYADYAYGNPGTLTFPAGTTVRTIRYVIVDDSIAENSETFTVTLSSPSNATLGAAAGTVTILDRDGGPVASITDNTTGVALFGSTVIYTITFSQDVTGLALDDFNLINVSNAQLSGSGANYTLTAPTAGGFEGYQLVTLKIDAVTNGSGIGNLPAGGAQQIDTLVPAITGITPADEASGVVRDTNIVISLSQAAIFGTGTITLNSPSGVFQSFNVANPGTAMTLSQDGRTLTLNPTGNLRYGTEYTLNVPAGALRDQAGNQVAAHTTHNFTTEPNTAPTSANGANSTLEDTPVTGVLPAYIDPNVGQTVIYGVAAQPGKGSVVVNANGSYTYTPSLNSNGADSFSFFVRDDEGAQNSYTMNLTVTPVNDAPTSANGTATFDEDTVFNGQLPVATDVDSTQLTYARASNPAKGSVVVNANGSYTYTPTLNANGSDSFSWTISDNAGGSNTYSVAVTINPVNDAPVGANGNITVNEDQVFAGSLPAASDVDGNALSFARVTAATSGNAVVNANGSWSYTPSANFSGSDSFNYSVSDGHGGSATYSMAITVASIVDTFTGTAGNDSMGGFAGADSYVGLAGNDTIVPGLGNDSLNGGEGLDWASYADRGSDTAIQANLATGVVNIGAESDLLTSIEAVIGSGGADVLVGNDADYNLFVGGAGADTIDGGANGATPGYNVDIAAYLGANPVTASLQSGTGSQGGATDTFLGGIEALFGGSGADSLSGRDSALATRGETLRGGAGNDTIDGLGGVDTAEFTGPRSNYTVTRASPTATTITVTDNVGGEGVDSVLNAERLMFSDIMLAFGQRAEELARVSFVLWTPGIIVSTALYARGYSYYDNGYDFNTMCNVALLFHGEQGLAFAQKLKNNMPATTRTVDDIMTIMNNAGGGDAGRAAAVAAMANDPATTAAIVASGIQTNGVAADLAVAGFGTLFGLLPGLS